MAARVRNQRLNRTARTSEMLWIMYLDICPWQVILGHNILLQIHILCQCHSTSVDCENAALCFFIGKWKFNLAIDPTCNISSDVNHKCTTELISMDNTCVVCIDCNFCIMVLFTFWSQIKTKNSQLLFPTLLNNVPRRPKQRHQAIYFFKGDAVPRNGCEGD